MSGEDNLGLRYLAALSLAPGTKPTSFNQVIIMMMMMVVLVIAMVTNILLMVLVMATMSQALNFPQPAESGDKPWDDQTSWCSPILNKQRSFPNNKQRRSAFPTVEQQQQQASSLSYKQTIKLHSSLSIFRFHWKEFEVRTPFLIIPYHLSFIFTKFVCLFVCFISHLLHVC